MSLSPSVQAGTPQDLTTYRNQQLQNLGQFTGPNAGSAIQQYFGNLGQQFNPLQQQVGGQAANGLAGGTNAQQAFGGGLGAIGQLLGGGNNAGMNYLSQFFGGGGGGGANNGGQPQGMGMHPGGGQQGGGPGGAQQAWMQGQNQQQPSTAGASWLNGQFMPGVRNTEYQQGAWYGQNANPNQGAQGIPGHPSTGVQGGPSVLPMHLGQQGGANGPTTSPTPNQPGLNLDYNRSQQAPQGGIPGMSDSALQGGANVLPTQLGGAQQGQQGQQGGGMQDPFGLGQQPAHTMNGNLIGSGSGIPQGGLGGMGGAQQGQQGGGWGDVGGNAPRTVGTPQPGQSPYDFAKTQPWFDSAHYANGPQGQQGPQGASGPTISPGPGGAGPQGGITPQGGGQGFGGPSGQGLNGIPGQSSDFYNQLLGHAPGQGPIGAGQQATGTLGNIAQTGGGVGQGGPGAVLNALSQYGGFGGGSNPASGFLSGLLQQNPSQGILGALQPQFQHNLSMADNVGGRFGSSNALGRAQATNDYNLMAQNAMQQGVGQQVNAAQILGNQALQGQGLNQQGALGAFGLGQQGQQMGVGNQLNAAGQLGGFNMGSAQGNLGAQLQGAGAYGNLGQQNVGNQLTNQGQTLGAAQGFAGLGQQGMLGGLGALGNLAGGADSANQNQLMGANQIGNQQSGQGDVGTQRLLQLLQQQLGVGQQTALGQPNISNPGSGSQLMSGLASLGPLLAQLLQGQGGGGGNNGGMGAP